MAGETTSVLLEAAGIAPKQYGTQISVENQNRSVMFNKVQRYVFPPGQELHVPKMDKRAATKAATQPTSITFTALAGTKKTLTNAWSYDGYLVQQQALDSMSPERLRMNLNAVIPSAGMALANQLDADLLGLYGSYAGTQVDASSTFDIAAVRTMIGTVRVGDATDGPAPITTPQVNYYCVLHDFAWDDLDAALAGVNAYRGDFPTDDATGDFMYRKTMFSCTGNVPVSTTRRGVIFSGGAFGVAVRQWVQTKDAFDIDTMSHKFVIYSDYAYALVRPGWACEVLTAAS
jgi:hypothetical protein